MFPPPVPPKKKFFRRQRSRRHHRRRACYIFVCAKNYSSYICYLAWWSVITIHIIAQEVFLFFSLRRIALCSTHSAMLFFAPLLFKELFSHRVFLSAPPKWIKPPLSLFCEFTANTKENQHAIFVTPFVKIPKSTMNTHLCPERILF